MRYSRYLAVDEYEDYIFRANHPNLGALNPSYWKGWRLVGILAIVALALIAFVSETLATGSAASGFGSMVSVVGILAAAITPIALIFSGIRAIFRRKKK